jgi:hypothetical protein
VWKRICAYILGIPLAFFGVLYAYSWHQRQQAAEQGRKVLADLAGKYEALDSFGDIDLDPSGLTLARLEERFHQPARTLRGAQNTTTVGWACMSEQCAIWVSFLAPPDRKLDPGAVPVALGIHDSRQIRPHRIAVGGIYLGEPIEDAKQFCKKRGYGVELGLNQVTWDKHWKAICAGTGAKVDLLVFANQDLMKVQSKQ